MKISYKIVGRSAYVGMCGELDECSSVLVREQLDGIIDKGGFDKMVMELSMVTFMDSTGIGVLIGRYKRLKENNIPILLASPSRVVDKVLNLTGIYKLMPKINY